MNLGIGRVRNVTGENVFSKDDSLYRFVVSVEGKKYEQLSQCCKDYYNKKDFKYFGQIITPINLLGLIEIDKNGKLKNNILLESILKSKEQKIIHEYMNYFLCMWQFPIPSTKCNCGRNLKIFKPYCILLKMLVEMNKIDSEEAYLTQYDFLYLFLDDSIKQMLDVKEITSEYAKNIILTRNIRKKKGLSQEHSSLKYILNTLSESDLLTKDKSYYNNVEDFYIGLKNDCKDTIKIAEFVIREYNNKYFDFNINNAYNDRVILNNYSKFMNDMEKFLWWRKTYMNISRISEFIKFCRDKGFYYSEDIVRRFVLSLETKPFLILAGISGSGKTKIAELWISYLQEKNEGEGLKIAVGSNWSDNKKLLGFCNIFLDKDESYQSTELVDIIKKANLNQYKEYIVIFDEMNLSKVEMYFADFLSALESLDHSILLPNGEKIFWSNNLKIIGTVNVDESTYMFSSKVLDRANVIEMNGIEPKSYINNIDDSISKDYKKLKDISWYDDYVELLNKIYYALDGQFAFRIIDEISRYMIINSELYGDSQENYYKFFDEQINQKILPKLHGSRAQLKPKLDKLYELFSQEERFVLVNKKLLEMLEDIKKGYTSYIGD